MGLVLAFACACPWAFSLNLTKDFSKSILTGPPANVVVRVFSTPTALIPVAAQNFALTDTAYQVDLEFANFNGYLLVPNAARMRVKFTNTAALLPGTAYWVEWAFDGSAVGTREKLDTEYWRLLSDGSAIVGVQAASVAPNSVTGAGILDGSVTSADIAANSITATHLAPGSVTSSKIAVDAVASAQIAAGAITSGKIAPSAVNSSHIIAGGVTGLQVLDGSLTASDLALNSISGTVIANDAISSSKILDNSVTSADIGDVTRYINLTAGDFNLGSGASADYNGILFQPNFTSSVRASVPMPNDWNGTSNFVLTVYFTPIDNLAGVVSFFVRVTGRSLNETLNDPGSIVSPGVSVSNDFLKLKSQSFVIPAAGFASTDGIIHIYAIQRGGTGETSTSAVYFNSVKIAYTATR